MPIAPRPHQRAAPTARREYDQRRGTANERGYSKAWAAAMRYALGEVIAETGDTRCRYCRNNEAVTMDHAVPPTRLHAVGSAQYRAAFEDQRLWVPCCIRCNTEKSDMLPDEYKKRFPVKYERMVVVLSERGVVLR